MDIKDLLKFVVAKNASDLHLAVGVPPTIRLHGILEKIGEKSLTNDEIFAMLKNILPLEKHIVVGEEMDLCVEMGSIGRFRLNVYFDRRGVCAAFRLVPATIHSLKELGLPEIVSRVADMKRGLVLVTGTTGSGKSSTLAAIIDIINSKMNQHVITIEDPIEFIHEHKDSVVNQREVGRETRSFQQALRAALRQDPDVILVGELRDLETIAIAITAAETGHLVLGTLHTRSAAQTINRIIDIFPSDQQDQIRVELADALEMVISQVLIPSQDGKRRYLGCEVLVMTTAIRQHILHKKTHQITTEIETGAQLGMQTMERSLKVLVEAGKISRDLALSWATDKKFLEKDISS